MSEYLYLEVMMIIFIMVGLVLNSGLLSFYYKVGGLEMLLAGIISLSCMLGSGMVLNTMIKSYYYKASISLPLSLMSVSLFMSIMFFGLFSLVNYLIMVSNFRFTKKLFLLVPILLFCFCGLITVRAATSGCKSTPSGIIYTVSMWGPDIPTRAFGMIVITISLMSGMLGLFFTLVNSQYLFQLRHRYSFKYQSCTTCYYLPRMALCLGFSVAIIPSLCWTLAFYMSNALPTIYWDLIITMLLISLVILYPFLIILQHELIYQDVQVLFSIASPAGSSWDN